MARKLEAKESDSNGLSQDSEEILAEDLVAIAHLADQPWHFGHAEAAALKRMEIKLKTRLYPESTEALHSQVEALLALHINFAADHPGVKESLDESLGGC